MEKKHCKFEVLCWSIALPGFGQILNAKLFKGLLIIGLELLNNVRSHFNEAIRLSFYGKTQEAIQITRYSWLMFYPCLYFFAMWDAYKDAGGRTSPHAFFPFVFAAYFVTQKILLYASYIGE